METHLSLHEASPLHSLRIQDLQRRRDGAELRLYLQDTTPKLSLYTGAKDRSQEPAREPWHKPGASVEPCCMTQYWQKQFG